MSCHVMSCHVLYYMYIISYHIIYHIIYVYIYIYIYIYIFGELSHDTFRCIILCSQPGHYLIRCWSIVNWISAKEIWITIQHNQAKHAMKHVIYTIVVISSRWVDCGDHFIVISLNSDKFSSFAIKYVSRWPVLGLVYYYPSIYSLQLVLRSGARSATVLRFQSSFCDLA